MVVIIQRGWNGDDEHVARRHAGPVEREIKLRRGGQFFGRGFAGFIMPGAQAFDPPGANIDPDCRVFLSEGDRHGQADIAEANHPDPRRVQRQRKPLRFVQAHRRFSVRWFAAANSRTGCVHHPPRAQPRRSRACQCPTDCLRASGRKTAVRGYAAPSSHWR